MFGLVTALVALSIGLVVWYMATKTIVVVARDRGSELPTPTFWLFALFLTPLSALLLAILSVSGTPTAVGATHGRTTTATNAASWEPEGSAGNDSEGASAEERTSSAAEGAYNSERGLASSSVAKAQNPVTSLGDRASQGSVDFIAFMVVAVLVLVISLFLLLGR